MKRWKKIQKMLFMLCIVFFSVLLMQKNEIKAADRVYVPDRAVRKGDNIYWAMGNDSKGEIYCYNLKNKKKTVVVKDGCKELSVKGQYLYYTVNKYIGTDYMDNYIYRSKTNGSGKEKLADGYSPIIVGNYIYYIGIQKSYCECGTVDGKWIGIYRMKLNGKGKKCIYKCNESVWGAALYSAQKKLIFKKGNKWYSINLKGKNEKPYIWSAGSQKCNTTTARYGYDWVDVEGQVSNNNKGDIYTPDGGTLCRNGKSVIQFDNETIAKIIDLNGYLFVITETNTFHARAYVVKQNGKEKKRLYNEPIAGGGW